MNMITLWQIGCIALAIGILVTTIPITTAFLKKIKLNDVGTWFQDGSNLGDQQTRLQEHFSRIQGTLVFWKNKAAAHHRLHSARVIWSLISAVSLPVLIQFYDSSDKWAVAFLTGLTIWTGFIVALAYTFKSEQKYQGFRQQESDYYDISRNLLDFPDDNADTLKVQVDEYIKKVENIRKFARNVETGSPPSAI